VRIRSLKTASNFTLTLTKIQPGAPPDELFLPPGGFTKYDSEEALLAELTSRQQEMHGGWGQPPGGANWDRNVPRHGRSGD
jgi:hypothetical protein